MAQKKKSGKTVEGKNSLMVNGKDWDKSAVMAHVLTQLSTTANGLGKILAAGVDGNALPAYSTIDKWLTEDAELSERYARAKASQADVLADEIVGLADDCKDHNKCRLQIDARKWVAAKLKPKKYGDKLDVAHGGSVTLNVTNNDMEIL